MKLCVIKETAAGERRVSATPETVKKFIGLGATVAVEPGAGQGASIADESYAEAGASVADRASIIAGADAILSVQAPASETIAGVRRGAWLVGIMDPFTDVSKIERLADLGIEALAMDFMPRITRAQSMDTLSSQSNLAGYKAVLDAASEFGRAFPMMMTAAGTISAARAFVMGVGVAGLQAIATARRLGAQVSATDVRSAVREQIQSLGAKPVFVDQVAGIEGEGAGGYAGEMSAEYQKAQAELISAHIAKQDVVITTALIPGKPAPRLLSDTQVASMKPGSVIVDLAAEQGGNVEGSVLGEVVVRHGVTIVAHRNVPSRLAADASALYSRNLLNFLSAFWDKGTGRPVLPDEDEIVAGIRLTRDGKIVNPRLLTQLSGV